MTPKRSSSVRAVLTLLGVAGACLWPIAPSLAFEDLNRPSRAFEDLNRPITGRHYPGITGCGRDGPCDWRPLDRSRDEYRQPDIYLDLAVPVEPGSAPRTGRSGRLVQPNGRIEAHRGWCLDRYRSYDARNDTFQPYYGPRRTCRSPYR